MRMTSKMVEGLGSKESLTEQYLPVTGSGSIGFYVWYWFY